MSAPEINVFSPAPRITITCITGSAAKSASIPGIAAHISYVTALRRSGLLKIIQPIGPSFFDSSDGVVMVMSYLKLSSRTVETDFHRKRANIAKFFLRDHNK